MSRQAALLIFLVALAVRSVYLAAFYETPDSLRSRDSGLYEQAASSLVETGRLAIPAGQDRPQSFLARGPGYAAWLAAFQAAFGENRLYPVAAQLLLDALACVLVAVLAGSLSARLAVPAGFLASVNLNMIAHAALVDRGSLLLLLLLGSVLLVLRYLGRPSLGTIIAAGACLAAGWLTVPILAPLALLLLVVPVVAAWHIGTTAKIATGHAVAAALVLAILVGPAYVAHQRDWGHARLSTEVAALLYQRTAPAVLELGSGLPRAEAIALLEERRSQERAARGGGQPPANPFSVAALEGAAARSVMADAGVGALATAWAAGLTINLLAPAMFVLPPVQQMDRPRFFATPGVNPAHKIWAFIAGSGLFAVAVVAGALFTGVCRLFAVVALIRWRRPAPAARLLVALSPPFYLLVVSGPVIGLEARLSFEPMLDILLAAGVFWLLDRWRYGAAVRPRASSSAQSIRGKRDERAQT